MNTALRRILGPLLVIAMMGLAAPALAADAKVSIEGKYDAVAKLHYLVAGRGEPVILLSRLRAEQPHVAPAHGRAWERPGS